MLRVVLVSSVQERQGSYRGSPAEGPRDDEGIGASPFERPGAAQPAEEKVERKSDCLPSLKKGS